MQKTTSSSVIDMDLGNLNNIVGKIQTHADKLGALYGYLQPMASTNPSDPIGGIITEHTQILSNLKIPTLASLRWHFETWTKPAFTTALMAYLGGELVGMIDVGIGASMKKFGNGAFKGAIASTIVMSLGGGGGYSPSNSRSNSSSRVPDDNPFLRGN